MNYEMVSPLFSFVDLNLRGVNLVKKPGTVIHTNKDLLHRDFIRELKSYSKSDLHFASRELKVDRVNSVGYVVLSENNLDDKVNCYLKSYKTNNIGLEESSKTFFKELLGLLHVQVPFFCGLNSSEIHLFNSENNNCVLPREVCHFLEIPNNYCNVDYTDSVSLVQGKSFILPFKNNFHHNSIYSSTFAVLK